jgi:hypothetical protein
MITKLTLALACLFTGVAMVACGSHAPTHKPTPAATLPPFPTGWQTHAASGFSIALPERWNVVNVEREGFEAVWSLLQDTNTEWARTVTAMFSAETVRQMIRLLAIDPEPAGTGYATLTATSHAELFSLQIEDLCTRMTAMYEQAGIELLGTECNLAINGLDAARFTIRVQVDAFDFKEYQYILVRGTHLWSLTFGVNAPDWAVYEPVFVKAAESFQADEVVP